MPSGLAMCRADTDVEFFVRGAEKTIGSRPFGCRIRESKAGDKYDENVALE